MSKVMLVNVTHVEESRVAVLDKGVLDAYEIETINRTHVKGNIYNAVVESVHPNLEAAFVKLDNGLKGFLPLDEINKKLLPARGDRGKGGKIGQHLHPGQKIMAQVVREPFAGKPPSVSTYFSLPGRFLVLMPGVDDQGVSRKIDDGEQRDRLKKIVKELNVPDGFGLIVRTAGIGQTKTELQRDLRYLLRLWQSIQKSSADRSFPGLVYREADLVIRTIRDYFTPDISEVWIDSKETYERALAFVRDVMPTKAKIVRLYTGDKPLFNKHDLEEQIESIYKRRVTLPSGGEIVIDGTEALTAIDVNSKRSKKKKDAEETALDTNLEAAREIARQLRLRDLGGLIVIDFIDLYRTGNKKKLEKEIKDSMRGDKAKHDVTRISKLGLVEIARQRIKAAKMSATYTSCPTCEGYGLIKTIEAAAISALRKLQTRSARGDMGRIKLGLPPEVAQWMLNNKREELSQIERRHRLSVDVEHVDSMLRHETRFETFPREAAEEGSAASYLPEVPDVPPVEVPVTPDADADAEAASDNDDETEAKPAPKKRRGRRGGRRRTAAKRAAAGSKADEPDDEAGDDVPAEPAADTTDGDTDESADGGGRKRRRRRRRRTKSGDDADAAAGPEPEVAVPAKVRSDELMPAAVGGDGARRTRGRRGGRRRG